MTRRFNTVGACQSEQHYFLDARERLPQVKTLVEQSGCFWVYGPRQIGKTTAMALWAKELTKHGRYAALLVSAASLAESVFEDGAIAEESFLYELREAASNLPEDCQPPDWGYQIVGQRIRAALATWAEVSPRPLVLFIDDVETLTGRSLTLLLRQLWSGFTHRSSPFPHAVALIGLRDVNSIPVDSAVWTPGSLFHKFRTATLALQSFTLEEVANIYQTHTDATGQLFTLEAVDRAFELTQGQPWLVNALAQYAIEHNRKGPIESLHIEAAATHLLHHQNQSFTLPIDHLSTRLMQFQSLLEPVLAQRVLVSSTTLQVLDLVATGLCRLDPAGGLMIANPLYRQVVMQQLALPAIASLGFLDILWLNVDGTVNINNIWDTFVRLWQTQGDALIQTVLYESIAPYLAVFSFFHRLTQPRGSLKPTYEFQHQQMQLTMTLTTPSISMDMVVQVMVWHDGYPDPIQQGLAQLDLLLRQSSTRGANAPSEPVAGMIIIDQRRDRLPCNERTRLESITTSTGMSLPMIRG